jgi:hypothetical protein
MCTYLRLPTAPALRRFTAKRLHSVAQGPGTERILVGAPWVTEQKAPFAP